MEPLERRVEAGLRILVVSQYFWPEDFRINELVEELEGRGGEVTVLTGVPNYPAGREFPAYHADRRRFDRYGAARVVRVPMLTRGRSAIRLVANYLSFAVSASVLGPLRLRGQAFDVVFAFQPSPVTVGLPAIALGRLKGAPVVLWVLDQWPETLAAVGVVRSRSVLALVGSLVRFIYRRCALIAVQSRSLIRLAEKYSGGREVVYFPNWVEAPYDAEVAVPAPEVERREDLFTIGFAGNIGEAQDFPSVLEAAGLLQARADVDVRWVIVGDGRMRGWLEAEVRRRGMEERFLLVGSHPAERMGSFFAHADALLVTLRPDPLFAMTVPGKLQTYLAAGRPIIGMLDGDGAEVIRESGAGFVAPAGDASSLAALILSLAAMPLPERAEMGRRGREYSRQAFDRETLMSTLHGWLTRLSQTREGMVVPMPAHGQHLRQS